MIDLIQYSMTYERPENLSRKLDFSLFFSEMIKRYTKFKISIILFSFYRPKRKLKLETRVKECKKV